MKNFKLQSIALIMLFVTVLTSCSSDNDAPEDPKVVYKTAYATSVVGPTTGKVGQELSYDIEFTSENGCGEFHQLVEVEYNKVLVYQVEAQYPIATCAKTTPERRVTVYKITPQTKGTFYLRLAKSETEYISTTVVVE